MHILLIGCTGFVGEAIIFKLLRDTKHKLIIALRPKNGKSIEQRLHEMLDSVRLSYPDYASRLTPVKVGYTDTRAIVISERDDAYIKKKASVFVNALADVNMNRELRKAALNNTVTALNWMAKFQECKSPRLYLYLSTAFVNFHRLDKGEVPEEILERGMSAFTLRDILARKHSYIGRYENTYVYTKQLTEVLLEEAKRDKRLVIIRPSIVIPALEAPYPGWGKIQTISYMILGISTGILSMVRCPSQSHKNTVPVDLVADDCLNVIDRDQDDGQTEIRHMCLTGNVRTWLSPESFTILRRNAYEYFVVNPLILQNRQLFPFKVEFKAGWRQILLTLVVHVIRMVCHWWKWADTWEDLAHILCKSMLFTYRFDRHLARFGQKELVFKRAPKPNDISYPTVAFEECYFEFVKEFQNAVGYDSNIVNLFF